jgi:membrane protein implicated in regulation of membrane protease activity
MAAFIMSPISLLGLPIYVEILIFLALSVVLLVCFRSLYINRIKPQTDLKDNLTDKILSSTGIVTTTIDNEKNEGQIIIGDIHWRAISEDGTVINKEEKVSITKVENTKVFVKKI